MTSLNKYRCFGIENSSLEYINVAERHFLVWSYTVKCLGTLRHFPNQGRCLVIGEMPESPQAFLSVACLHVCIRWATPTAWLLWELTAFVHQLSDVSSSLLTCMVVSHWSMYSLSSCQWWRWHDTELVHKSSQQLPCYHLAGLFWTHAQTDWTWKPPNMVHAASLLLRLLLWFMPMTICNMQQRHLALPTFCWPIWDLLCAILSGFAILSLNHNMQARRSMTPRSMLWCGRLSASPDRLRVHWWLQWSWLPPPGRRRPGLDPPLACHSR